MKFKLVVIGVSISVAVFFILLLASAALFADKSIMASLLGDPRILYSLRLSLITSTISTVLALFVAVPASYALSRYDFFGKTFIDTLSELPLVLSPVALGAVLLILLSSDAGMAIQERGMAFVFEVPGIILAQFVTVVGVAIRLMKSSFDEISPRYESVARSLGAPSHKAFLLVTLPLAKRGIIAAALLTWAKAIGEFGATITLAGAMAMKTETLPVAIFNALSASEIDKAVLLILVLAVIGILVLYFVRLITQRGQIAHH